MPPTASLRSRLLVIFAVAISPFVLYAAVSASREKDSRGSFLHAETVARARATAHELDNSLVLIDGLLDSAASQLRSRGAPSLSGAPMDSVPLRLSSALVVAALDSIGTRTGTFHGSGATVDGIPLARRSTLVATAIENARRSKTGTVGWFADEGDERTSRDSVALIIVRPVTRAADTPLCSCLADSASALVAVLTDNAIRALLGTDSLPKGAAVMLAGSHSAAIGKAPAANLWIDADSRDSLSEALATQRDGSVELLGADKAPRTLGFSKLQRLPWRVIVGLQAATVSTLADKRIRDTLLLALLAMAIAGAGLWSSDKGLDGPVQTLLRDANKMLSGGVGLRSEVAGMPGDIGALGTAVNALATDAELKQAAMREDLRIASETFAAIPTPVWIADGSPAGAANGRILRANSAAERLFGATPGGLVGRYDFELVKPESTTLLAPAQQKSMGTRIGGATLSGDPASRQYIVTVAPIANEGVPLRVVSIAPAQHAAAAVPVMHVAPANTADAAVPTTATVEVSNIPAPAPTAPAPKVPPKTRTKTRRGGGQTAAPMIIDVPFAPSEDEFAPLIIAADSAVQDDELDDVADDEMDAEAARDEALEAPAADAAVTPAPAPAPVAVAVSEPVPTPVSMPAATMPWPMIASEPAAVPAAPVPVLAQAEEPRVVPAEEEPVAVPVAEETMPLAVDSGAPVAPVASSEAPASEAPASEAPASEAPASEAPASEAPASEAPASEAPASEAPASEKSARGSIYGPSPLIDRRGPNRAVLPSADELEAAVDAFADFAVTPFAEEAPRGSEVNAIVGETAKRIASTFGPRVSVSIDCNGPASLIATDRAAVEQMVTLLMSRGRDVMAGSGKLTVSTTQIDIPSDSPVPQPAPAGRYSALQIADSGRGLSMEAQQRMFEAPGTAPRAPSLTPGGRGLTEVADLARQHGWVITVESQQQRGTTFTIYMPLLVETAPAEPAGQSAFERMLSRNR